MTNRLLFITHQLMRTGAPLALMELIRFQKNRGCYIEVISMSEGSLRAELEDMGITVSIHSGFLQDWEIFIEKFKKFECVFCNTLITFEAIHVLNHTDIPTIWWIHEPENYFELYKDVLPDFAKLNQNISVISASPLISDIIEKRYGTRPETVSFMVEDLSSRKYTRDKDSDKVTFICVGIYSHMKGQDVLADAIKKLPIEIRESSRFIIYGDMKNSDQEILKKLRGLEGIDGQILINDSVPHQEIVEAIARSDYMITPSRVDTVSGVSAEAMMLGIPVIITEACGIVGIVEKRGCITVPAEDSDALASAIVHAARIKATEEYENLRSEARIGYESAFLPETFYKSMEKVLEEKIPPRRIVFWYDGHDVLDQFSDRLVEAFRQMGYEVLIMGRQDIMEDMRAFAGFYEKGMVTAFLNYNFYGSFLELHEGENFWTHFGIPQVTMLMDHPFCFDKAFAVYPEGNTVLCPDRNHVEYVLKNYPNVSAAAFLPHGGFEYTEKCKAVSDRSIDVVYTGGISAPNAYKIMPDFSKFVFDAKNVADEAIEILISEPWRTTEEVLESCLLDRGIELPVNELRKVIADLHYVDLLAVSHYREEVIRTLSKAGIRVTLYGFGWEKCEWLKNSSVDYRGRISAYDIPNIMSDSKIVLSTMAWFKDGTHDRVFNGMLSGALAVTDTSKYMTEEFSGIYAGEDYSIEDAQLGFFRLTEIGLLPDMISYLLSHTNRMQQIADFGRVSALNSHTWRARAEEIDRDLLQFL